MKVKQSFSLALMIGAGFNLTWIYQGIEHVIGELTFIVLFFFGLVGTILFSEEKLDKLIQKKGRKDGK